MPPRDWVKTMVTPMMTASATSCVRVPMLRLRDTRATSNGKAAAIASATSFGSFNTPR
jgi:hypothetical protein